MKENLKTIAFYIIIIIIGLLLLGFVGSYQKEDYNHGICLECGGHYEPVGITRQGYQVYTCEYCGNTLRFY